MRKLYLMWMIAFLLLTACTGKDTEPVEKEMKDANEATVEEEPQDEEKEEKEKDVYMPAEAAYYEIEDPGRELTEIEEELLRKPGIFSGDQYDEVKVNEALDQLPENLTREAYLEELKYLLAEDYHEELETFVHFDSTVHVDIDRPDETVDVPKLKTAHYAILIDASGSMKAMVGIKNRMQAAKSAVKAFAEQVPENATLSMRVYGHKGSGSDTDKDLSCTSTESFYNGEFENKKFKKALDKVKPAGWTPIGLALETVVQDIPENTDDVIVYVVSDGIETCGGDPVKAAEALASADIDTVVNIIGFDVDNKGQKLLKEVASAGNGEFTYVDSEQDLNKYMKAQYEEIQEAWREWTKEGKKQANEQMEEKKKLARSAQESMQKKSDQENERMKQAADYLQNKYNNNRNHDSASLPTLIMDDVRPKSSYATDMGRKFWGESYDSGREESRDIDDEGNEEINKHSSN